MLLSKTASSKGNHLLGLEAPLHFQSKTHMINTLEILSDRKKSRRCLESYRPIPITGCVGGIYLYIYIDINSIKLPCNDQNSTQLFLQSGKGENTLAWPLKSLLKAANNCASYKTPPSNDPAGPRKYSGEIMKTHIFSGD